MALTDVLSSPTTRTAQTSLFMFGKTELSPARWPSAATPWAMKSSATNSRDAT